MMILKRSALCAVMAVMLAGCGAGYSRVSQYPGHLPGNYTMIEADGQAFSYKRHPQDDTLLIQTSVMRAAGAGIVSGLTMGGVSASTAATIEPRVREAARIAASMEGCTVADLYPLGTVSWEARLNCSGE